MSRTIRIPGHFQALGIGVRWLNEICTLVSDLPDAVTGFRLTFHASLTSSAPSPTGRVFVGKLDKPRTIPSEPLDVQLAAGGDDYQASGSFGAAHSSDDPVLVGLGAECGDASAVIDVYNVNLELLP